ncbi:hypothetical protein P691DRAFT_662504, partial [Macrolepiota fuliginosa MF-IS2]
IPDIYYLAFPQDRWQVKSIVYFVYGVGTIQTVFALRDFYILFCILGGNMPTGHDLRAFGFMWFTIPVSSALVAVVSQLFYAHRIYIISNKKWITTIVSVLAILQFICGVVSAATVYNTGQDLTNIFGRVGALVNAVIWGYIGMVCDLIIMVYMFRFLSKQLTRASRDTQVSLTKMKRILLETGILTAAMAAAYVIMSTLISVFSGWFIILGLSLNKLYGNSILVLLNNRFTIFGGRNAPHPDFDIVSYHRSDANEGPVMSGTAFAHNRATET